MKPTVLFFDCWYTLFEGELANNFRKIAALLGTSADRAFVKRFEQHFMTMPHSDLRVPASGLVADFGIKPTEPLAHRIADLLTEGLGEQKPYPDSLAALDRLREQYRLGLITNSFSLGFERLRADFQLDNRFDAIITSYDVGTLKPDPAIFQAALIAVAVEPAQALMIGDTPGDDVDAARRLGLSALLLDRRDRYPDYAGRITSLTQVESALKSAKI